MIVGIWWGLLAEVVFCHDVYSYEYGGVVLWIHKYDDKNDALVIMMKFSPHTIFPTEVISGVIYIMEKYTIFIWGHIC